MTEKLAKLFEDAVVTATENQRIAGEKIAVMLISSRKQGIMNLIHWLCSGDITLLQKLEMPK